tara:strand:+ start:2278 stop:4191 length:1914 start_codon:yes stop_codon:yes gene_type:complete
MCNLNLIIDNSTPLKSISKVIKLKPSKIILFDIENNQEYLQKLRNSIKSECVIKKIDLSSQKIRSSIILKNEYIDFIGSIASYRIIDSKGLDIKNFLNFGNLSYWWLTTIAEKNPLKRKTYSKVITLFNIIRIIKEHEDATVFINIRDRELSSALKENINNNLFILKYKKLYSESIYFLYSIFNASKLFAKLIIRSLICKIFLFNKRSSNNKISFTLVSSFTGTLRHGKKNPYFKVLIDEMKLNNTLFKHLYMLNTFNIAENVKDILFLKNSSDQIKFDAIDGYIGFFDIFLILKNYISLSFKLFKIKETLKNKFIFMDMNIYNLFIGDLYISFLGQTAIENLYQDILFRNYFLKNNIDNKIIYPMEMQAWEKIMNSNKNISSDNIYSYGLQHVPIPSLMLNYFYSKPELVEDDHLSSIPKPDLALLFSDYDLEVFKDMGWSQNRLISYGSIRFQNLEDAKEISWTKKENLISIVLPGDIDSCIELLEFLYPLVLEITDVKFTIIHHPEIIKYTLRIADKITELKNCNNSYSNSDELFIKSKALISYGTSAIIQGMLNSCFILVPVMSRSLPLDPAFNKIDSVDYVVDKKIMSESIKKLILLKEAPDKLSKQYNDTKKYLKFKNKKLYLSDLASYSL